MRVIFHIALLILPISVSKNLLSGYDQTEKQYGGTLHNYRRRKSTSQWEQLQNLSLILDQKLFQRIDETKLRSDPVSVVAAKLLGEPCGVKKYNEPGKQYTQLSGTCMPAVQCDPEFLVHGGAGCGRTNLVCCTTRLNAYEMEHSEELGVINKWAEKPNDITRRKDDFDPVNQKQASFRREIKDKQPEKSTDVSYSSSLELKDSKLEWKEDWTKKKVEAIKSQQPKGDAVNMVAARPWGVPCGDPNQYDMPTGNCLLAEECDSEFRIPRGDSACGRTMLVCCAVLHTNYDMNQAFDASFYDSGLTTSSEEKRNKGKNSREMAHRQRQRDKNRRQKERHRRKKKLKENIAKIVRNIQKTLKRQYSNKNAEKRKKIKDLKKFVKDLKSRFREDRKVAHNVQEIEMVKLDDNLMTKLGKIRDINVKFVQNDTFRDILLYGKMSRSGARMLVEAYPDLSPFIPDKTRRTGDADKPKDYLDYDIEYGMLYY